MTQHNGSSEREPRREPRRRPRRTRRYAAGIVAQYIHELSERHAEEERRGRELAPAPQPTS